jgi:hypothetical protein
MNLLFFFTGTAEATGFEDWLTFSTVIAFLFSATIKEDGLTAVSVVAETRCTVVLRLAGLPRST